MKRAALIISNPGEYGEDTYCEGVYADVRNYTRFLGSPQGGLWYDREVTHLARPSARQVALELAAMETADYSVIIFTGHGWHSDPANSTILELRKGQDFDSRRLRLGTQRRTVVLDCCRRVYAVKPVAKGLQALAESAAALDPAACRRCYDLSVSKCQTDVVILYACSVGETSGDISGVGGVYSSSLIAAAESWARTNRADYDTMSVATAHDTAVMAVRSRGTRQRPAIEKPRSGPYFPFAVVARA